MKTTMAFVAALLFTTGVLLGCSDSNTDFNSLTLTETATTLLTTESTTQPPLDTVRTEEYYGSDYHQRVTIIRPLVSLRLPVAYFIHGGGWTGGARTTWEAEALVWAKRGWVTINMGYRTGTLDGIPGDGRNMFADITTVVDKYEDKPYSDKYNQIVVGDSAGGHLATWAGAALYSHFQGVIAWSPAAVPVNAADRSAEGGAMGRLGRKADEFFDYSWSSTSAGRYVRNGTAVAPMFIVGARGEWMTWAEQGGSLCNTLGSKCTRVVVEDSNLHGKAIFNARPDLAEEARLWAEQAIN